MLYFNRYHFSSPKFYNLHYLSRISYYCSITMYFLKVSACIIHNSNTLPHSFLSYMSRGICITILLVYIFSSQLKWFCRILFYIVTLIVISQILTKLFRSQTKLTSHVSCNTTSNHVELKTYGQRTFSVGQFYSIFECFCEANMSSNYTKYADENHLAQGI